MVTESFIALATNGQQLGEGTSEGWRMYVSLALLPNYLLPAVLLSCSYFSYFTP
jgi:hypothetical protein